MLMVAIFDANELVIGFDFHCDAPCLVKRRMAPDLYSVASTGASGNLGKVLE